MPNLMTASGYGSTALTGAQADIILDSALLNKTGGNHINLQAITFVPEPGSLGLFLLAVVFVFVVQRYRRGSAAVNG
jgi:PEP-CTERM motif